MGKGKGGTANKQERAAKKQKKADKQAKAIIDQAYESMPEVTNQDARDAIDAAKAEAAAEGKAPRTRKPREASEADLALAQQVKALRDTGMAWWQIAHELTLPGSADNVKQGKAGAARARALYKKAFGTLPATPRSLASQRGDRVYGDGPRPSGVRKKDVIRKDPATATMFTEEHSDEEVAEMLRGKRITFVNSISNEQDTVRIHGKSKVEVIQAKDGRAVQFRETHEDDHHCDPKFRYLPAHMRTIILERIVRVAS